MPPVPTLPSDLLDLLPPHPEPLTNTNKIAPITPNLDMKRRLTPARRGCQQARRAPRDRAHAESRCALDLRQFDCSDTLKAFVTACWPVPVPSRTLIEDRPRHQESFRHSQEWREQPRSRIAKFSQDGPRLQFGERDLVCAEQLLFDDYRQVPRQLLTVALHIQLEV